MRIVLSFMALTAAAASAAFAADVKGSSKIEGVTVFPSGAEVIRRTTIKLEAGEHAVLLQDLPGQAIGASIRVEGKSIGGKLEIGSVDVRTLQVPLSDPGAGQTARKKIEDEIEKLRDERDAVESVAQTAKAQLAYLENLAKLPTTPSVASVGSGKEDWGSVYGVIGGRTAELAKVGLDTKIKLRAIDKQLVDWSKELAAASPKQESRTEARVNVVAAAPVEATLTIRYQVPNASWSAFYDARLTSGDKATAPKLGLTRRASIQQRTGEDWTDVAVALSTTRPGHTTAVPDLRVLHVDYTVDHPIAAGSAYSRSGAVMQDKLEEGAASLRKSKSDAPAAPAPATAEVTQISADATNAAFQTVFDIPGKVTIKTTGEVKRVQIEASELEPTLIVKSMPRHDTTAYLYAKMALPKTASPALAGPVSLFRDGVFVGNGRIPQLAPGEDHELGFGADDRVKIKRAVLEDKKGETGTFTTSKVEVRNFKITAKNHHARPVQIAILDQVPVSAQQDIKVEVMMAGPSPTRKDVGDVRGTLVWDMTVAPDEEKQIGFGYKVVWPNDKRIGYQLHQPNFNSQNAVNFGGAAKF